jgi:TonB-linked SusC/RagA family outer membrane protein
MKKMFLLFLGLFYFVILSFAQDRQIKGKVVDESGNGIPNANVVIRGNKNGVQTDAQGNFAITVPSGRVVLEISSTGYTTQSMSADGDLSVPIPLVRSIGSLDEVVVVGYQTVKRKDLLGSVSSVGARQLKDNTMNSAAQALAGRLAGVQITGTEGSPNAEVIIRVRGGGSITQDNSPLYIIDGIQVENALNTIAPQNIESVDVLKDASATAIYGSRGANGVVIITTKGGKNARPTISYDGYIGIANIADKLGVLKPFDYVQYQYERNKPLGAPDSTNYFLQYGTTWDTIQNYKNAPFIDWQEEMFGRNAISQTHNVSLNGGNAITQYNLTLTSNTEDGLMLASKFDRKLVAFRFDHNFTPKVKVGFNARYNKTIVDGAGTSNSGSISTNRLRQSVKYRPLLVAGQDLTDYDAIYAAQTNANSLALVNPLLLNEAEYRKEYSDIINLSAYVDWKLTSYLSFRSTYGYNLNKRRQHSYDDSVTNVSRQNSALPLAAISTTDNFGVINSNVLTFSSSGLSGGFVKKNVFSVLFGHEVNQSTIKNTNVLARFFPFGFGAEKALDNMNVGSLYTDPSRPTSSQFDDHLVSLFGKINYAYDDRFLAAFSLRADGSSKFRKTNKWGYFPAGSVAWRVSNEKFWDNMRSKISDFKLRVSYGEAGNNRIPNFAYLTQYLANTQYYINNQLISAYSSSTLANPDLVWETTISRNIGLDVGLLNNRIQFSVDLYRNTTKDLLINVPISTSLGYVNQIQNVGSTENQGVELQVNALVMSKRDFSWNINFNLSANRNRVTNLGNYLAKYPGTDKRFFLINSGWGISSTPADYIIREGDPVGSMYGFITDGYYSTNDFDYNNTTGIYTLKSGVASNQPIISSLPQPGSVKFRDISGPDGKPDGLINDFDKKVVGVAQPKVFGGINQQFTWKNFDLSVFVNYQWGNDVYNANKLEFTTGYTTNTNLLDIMTARWKNVDANGKILQRIVTISNVQYVQGVSPAELNANNDSYGHPALQPILLPCIHGRLRMGPSSV